MKSWVCFCACVCAFMSACMPSKWQPSANSKDGCDGKERYKQKTEIKIQGDIYIVILLFVSPALSSLSPPFFVTATAYISMRLSLIQNYISQLHKVTRPVCRSSKDRVTFLSGTVESGGMCFVDAWNGLGSGKWGVW